MGRQTRRMHYADFTGADSLSSATMTITTDYGDRHCRSSCGSLSYDATQQTIEWSVEWRSFALCKWQRPGSRKDCGDNEPSAQKIIIMSRYSTV